MDNRIKEFQEIVWDYYTKHGRDLPWRHAEKDGSFDPYKIMVSEVMLQQTQVQRVIPKYLEFITQFPTLDLLANSSLNAVFGMWNGLGYNRRAKFLLEAAKQIQHQGKFPKTLEELVKLPGIGKNTAAAICVYTYNQPLVFIETNIRTVFIYEFFKDKIDVDDKELLPLVQATLPNRAKEQPERRINSVPGAMRKTAGLSYYREWYWALMDYGTYIKTNYGNVARFSKHHVKQSQYEGSRRQLRAKVLKSLLTQQKTISDLSKAINDTRLASVLKDLEKEQLIIRQNKFYRLA